MEKFKVKETINYDMTVVHKLILLYLTSYLTKV